MNAASRPLVDVLVVGCGPTGAVLANLLGLRGLRVTVLERERDVFPVPRATHLDEETLRNLRATGLLGELLPHTSPFGTFEVADATGRLLLRDEVAAGDDAAGFVGSRFFDQPALEAVLRRGLARFPDVELARGVEVLGVQEVGDRVRVHARGAGGAVVHEASFVVGCDGGRSVVRGSVAGGVEELAPPERWVVVDTELSDSSTPLPAGFRYVLDPHRLTLYAHGFGAHRRWEFRLRRGEPDPGEEEVLGWLAAHVSPGRVRVLRITPYDHRALVARRWRAGRRLLAGDAAHLMPPFAGQGLCSGIRDALALAWRLDEVLRGRGSERLLDSYEEERRAHVREVTRGALWLGAWLRERGPVGRWLRSAGLRWLGRAPSVREVARRWALRRPAVTRHVGGGARARGRLLPALVVSLGGAPAWLDDVVGYRGALLARRGVLGPDEVRWAGAGGLVVVGADHLLDDGGAVEAWLRREGVDAVIVRPDRHVFGGASAAGLRGLLRAHDRASR